MVARAVAVGIAAVATAASLTACTSDGYGGSGPSVTTAAGGTTTGDSTAPAGNGVTISGFAFAMPASVGVGTPFTVTNADGTTHTFTNTDGAFDVTVPGGGSAEVTIATAGTYTVVCKIHASMSATITVK